MKKTAFFLFLIIALFFIAPSNVLGTSDLEPGEPIPQTDKKNRNS
jgi:hypothetical protein